MKKYTILFVDDEEQNGLTFKHAFFRQYHILTASSGRQALEMLQESPVHLIVSDQRMPGMSGIEFLRIAREKYPQAIRMIVTGYSDVEVVMQAVNELNIFHYVLKPWNNAELKIALDNALEKYQLTADKEQLISQLQELNTSLERKVEERTAELTKLNAVKDKLFSVVSHDLRGPLGSLSVFLDMYLKYDGIFTPDEIKGTMSQIHQSVIGLTEMLNNLLSWSQSQIDENDTIFKEIALPALLDKHALLYGQMAVQKNITLRHASNGKLPAVWGNDDLISIVLRNLLSNAIKFTPSGGSITLHAFPANEQVWISVSDTGVGISRENLEKLFELETVFTTVGTAKEKGTGLGLRLCREYAEKLGGSLSVESGLNQGTTFTLILPVLVSAEKLT